MKIAYRVQQFNATSQRKINQARTIIDEYLAQGFRLTLRQLYYQFVAREYIPNTIRAYKALGALIDNARYAGLIDWNVIEDRTRFMRAMPHWDKPSDIINSAVTQYARDLWQTQDVQPEVWIEKDALVGVIEGVCRKHDVPYFSCRGYVSTSEMHVAAERILSTHADGRHTLILHLGDHDPSGLDMSRDIFERLRLFVHYHLGHCPFQVVRVALNPDQIEQYDPPPNPAKESDSRFTRYVDETGLTDSWELDALSPTVIAALIEERIDAAKDQTLWKAAVRRQERERNKLQKLADTL